jgi:hypothetical protein
MEILDDGKYNDIISWLPTGDGFIIHDKKRFSEEVMPIYFKQSQYSSFVRRMSRWKFALVREGHKKAKFFHPLFVRGSKHNASCIRPVRQKRHGVGEEETGAGADEMYPVDMYLKAQRNNMNIPKHIGNPMDQYNSSLMAFMNQSQMSNPSTAAVALGGMGGASNLLHQGFVRGFNPQMTPEFMQMQMMMNQAKYVQQQMHRNQESEGGYVMAPKDLQQQQQQQDPMNHKENDPSDNVVQTEKTSNEDQKNATEMPTSSSKTPHSSMNMSMNMNQMPMMMNHGQGPTTANPMLMQMMQMNQGMMYHGQGHGMNPTSMPMTNPSFSTTMTGGQMSGMTPAPPLTAAAASVGVGVNGTSGYEYMVAQGMKNYVDPSIYTNGQMGTNHPFQMVSSTVVGQDSVKDSNGKGESEEQKEVDTQTSNANAVISESSEREEAEKPSIEDAENNVSVVGDVEV